MACDPHFLFFYLEEGYPKMHSAEFEKILSVVYFCKDLEVLLPCYHFLLIKCYFGATLVVIMAGEPLFSLFFYLEKGYPKMHSAKFEKILSVVYFCKDLEVLLPCYHFLLIKG